MTPFVNNVDLASGQSIADLERIRFKSIGVVRSELYLFADCLCVTRAVRRR